MRIWEASLRKIAHIIRTNNMDWLNVCVGRVRTGKSTLGWQSCTIIDPDFDDKHIAFTPAELKKLIRTTPRYHAIMYDETQSGLYSREAMGKTAREFNKILMKIAGLNLFFWFNIPSFLSLDWYVRKERIMSLTKTKWTPHYERIGEKDELTLKRGTFYVYDASKLTQIYKDDRMEEHYPPPTYGDSFKMVAPSEAWNRYLERKNIFMRMDESLEEGGKDG